MKLIENALPFNLSQLELSPGLIGTLLGFAAILFILYLIPIFFYRQVDSFKTGKNSKIFTQANLYKIPIRWVGLFLILVMSLFSKKYRVFRNNALNKPYNPSTFESDFLVLVSKEAFLPYAQYILHTVHYYQSIRTKRSIAKGLIGKLQLHASSYKLESNSSRMNQFNIMRFKLGQWIEPETEKQAIKFLNEETERETSLLFEGLIETRTVSSSNRKRF